MIKFEKLLTYTQKDLKSYLGNYLCATGYKVEKGDGYLFAKGTIPVMLVAHMDTARNEIPKKIIKLAGKICAENSLVGGDDRCGVWMIMNIIKKAKCSVLFLEDEEIGCVGARKFIKTETANFIKDNISFMIELDRRGSNDCVYYSNDNREFVKYIKEKTGTVEAYGSCSDISHLMPATKVAGVNLSCGYYNEHTKQEYIVVKEMESIMNRLIKFLIEEKEFPKFEYIAKVYQTTLWDWERQRGYGGGYGSGYGYTYDSKRTPMQRKALRTMREMILTVVLDEEIFGEGCDNEIEATGKNPAECWANLFLENEDICFSMITDYYFT